MTRGSSVPAIIVLLAGVLLANALLAREHIRSATDQNGVVQGVPSAWDREASAAASRGLTQLVDGRGAVVRDDQGGDIVGEGQAYGLLLAVAAGDAERFERIWRWTDENLRREDGSLVHRYRDGQVLDDEAAPDADLDAARALVLAADLFDHDGYLREARRIADAILDRQTVEVAGRRHLVAGHWAMDAPHVLNPSYLDPRAFSQLAVATGDVRWSQLRDSAYMVLEELTGDGSHLPPDWALLHEDGTVEPATAPGEGGDGAVVRFAFEAVRVPVRLAQRCDRRGRELAAALDRHLSSAAEGQTVLDLEGRPQVDTATPLGLVAAAAAAHASGDEPRARRLLAEASSMDQEHPTYYGGAWAALGWVMLSDGLLGRCPEDVS